MTKFHLIEPTKKFCVCTSSTTGIYIISAFHFITIVLILSTTSSSESLSVAGLHFDPFIQTASAAWGLLGIPIIMLAIVGNAYRIEFNTRGYYYYMAISILIFITQSFYFLFKGDTCTNLISEDVASSSIGNSENRAVCGIVDSFVFFWSMGCAFLFSYFAYVVWSESLNILEEEGARLREFGGTLSKVLEKSNVTERTALLARYNDEAYGLED